MLQVEYFIVDISAVTCSLEHGLSLASRPDNRVLVSDVEVFDLSCNMWSFIALWMLFTLQWLRVSRFALFVFAMYCDHVGLAALTVNTLINS